MRYLAAVCIVLAIGAGGVQAQDISKHLDPPEPPRYDEYVYLYELTLLEDLDDPWFAIDGSAEIMIRTEVTKNGHETGTWTMLIEGIDMDGDLANEYWVLDAEEKHDERKGKKAKIYSHFECDPLVPINLDIEVWELDSTNVGDVFEKLGKAAGQATEEGILKGYLWIGPVAETIGGLINAIGNDETSLGTESRLVEEGVSTASSPTTSYRYRTEYKIVVTDDQKCSGDTRETAWDRLGDPELDLSSMEFYRLFSMGWDESHPFTMCPSEALRRLTFLQEALDLSDELLFETETHPGMEHWSVMLKGATVGLACDGLEAEVGEALTGDVIPPFVYDANQAIDDGRALARDGSYELALTTCFEHIPELLRLNHPRFYWDGFESSDTDLWSATVNGGIVIID